MSSRVELGALSSARCACCLEHSDQVAGMIRNLRRDGVDFNLALEVSGQRDADRFERGEVDAKTLAGELLRAPEERQHLEKLLTAAKETNTPVKFIDVPLAGLSESDDHNRNARNRALAYGIEKDGKPTFAVLGAMHVAGRDQNPAEAPDVKTVTEQLGGKRRAFTLVQPLFENADPAKGPMTDQSFDKRYDPALVDLRIDHVPKK